MPLYRDICIDRDTRLCIWQITERAAELPCPEGVDMGQARSASRRLETLAVYRLLGYMTGQEGLVVGHDDNGKPRLRGWHISVSHTRGWAALMLSRSREVAVDIEYVSDRVGRIADRFIRPDENSNGLSCQLVNWSAKETVYKLLSEEHLQYFEMRLKPFSLLEKGLVEVEDLKESKTVTVSYEVNEDFVLTYSSSRLIP